MRAALWRALSYPVMVFLALCLVVAFIGTYVIPKFEDVFKGFGIRLPLITELLLAGSRYLVIGAIVAAAAVVVSLVVAQVLRVRGRHAGLRDAVGLRLPLVAPVLRRSLVARWCEAVRIGVSGGMDLPAAMRTAADAVGSPRLYHEADALAGRIESGHMLNDYERGRLIPATVVAAVDLASRQNALPETLGTLSEMYQQQARAKVGLIPAVLTPFLLALLTAIVGFIILAMFAPFVVLLRAVSGGGV
jgi:type IV pilus assembly protein PilC